MMIENTTINTEIPETKLSYFLRKNWIHIPLKKLIFTHIPSKESTLVYTI